MRLRKRLSKPRLHVSYPEQLLAWQECSICCDRYHGPSLIQSLSNSSWHSGSESGPGTVPAQWLSQCRPRTRSSSIPWEPVKKWRFLGAAPNWLNQGLWGVEPSGGFWCIFRSENHCSSEKRYRNKHLSKKNHCIYDRDHEEMSYWEGGGTRRRWHLSWDPSDKEGSAFQVEKMTHTKALRQAFQGKQSRGSWAWCAGEDTESLGGAVIWSLMWRSVWAWPGSSSVVRMEPSILKQFGLCRLFSTSSGSVLCPVLLSTCWARPQCWSEVTAGSRFSLFSLQRDGGDAHKSQSWSLQVKQQVGYTEGPKGSLQESRRGGWIGKGRLGPWWGADLGFCFSGRALTDTPSVATASEPATIIALYCNSLHKTDLLSFLSIYSRAEHSNRTFCDNGNDLEPRAVPTGEPLDTGGDGSPEEWLVPRKNWHFNLFHFNEYKLNLPPESRGCRNGWLRSRTQQGPWELAGHACHWVSSPPSWRSIVIYGVNEWAVSA